MNSPDLRGDAVRGARVVERGDVDGATIIVLPDRSLPIVRFAVGLRRGALIDPLGKAGRSRVMLELLLRGTALHDRAQWNGMFERLGSQIGASIAGDFGLVHGVTLKRNRDATFALLAEALSRPAFADAEREPLIAEVTEQLKSERDDDESLLELFSRRALYPDHPSWRRPGGEPDDIRSLSHADIHAAYREHLVRRDLMVAFAGDISLAEAEALAHNLIADLPREPLASPTLPPFPEPAGVEILVVDKPERSQAQLAVGRLALSGSDPDLNAFWLGVVAFGGTFTSLFTREVRDVRGWSYTAHAEFPRRRRFKTPLLLKSAPATKDLVDCLALELDLYRTLARGEIAPEAIEFAKSYLLNRYPLEIANPADLLLPVLRNELLGLPPDEVFRTPERLSALHPSAVAAALSRHLHPERVLAVMVVTAAEVVPALRERLPQARIHVVDYREGETTAVD